MYLVLFKFSRIAEKFNEKQFFDPESYTAINYKPTRLIVVQNEH